MELEIEIGEESTLEIESEMYRTPQTPVVANIRIHFPETNSLKVVSFPWKGLINEIELVTNGSGVEIKKNGLTCSLPLAASPGDLLEIWVRKTTLDQPSEIVLKGQFDTTEVEIPAPDVPYTTWDETSGYEVRGIERQRLYDIGADNTWADKWAISKEKFLSGEAIEFYHRSIRSLVGISPFPWSTPAAGSVTYPLWSFYRTPNGKVHVAENGLIRWSSSSASGGSLCKIEHLGTTLNFYLDGSLVYSVSVSPATYITHVITYYTGDLQDEIALI